MVVGLAVGGAARAALLATILRRPPQRLPIHRPAAAVLAAWLLLHLHRWPAEQAIRRLAAGLSLVRTGCG